MASGHFKLFVKELDPTTYREVALDATKADVGKDLLAQLRSEFKKTVPAKPKPPTTADVVHQHALQMGPVTTKDLVDKLSINRSSVSTILNNDPRLAPVPKNGRPRKFVAKVEAERQ